MNLKEALRPDVQNFLTSAERLICLDISAKPLSEVESEMLAYYVSTLVKKLFDGTIPHLPPTA